MKIWFDVLTPKQVLFFHPLVEELEARGHRITATSRHYREVESLAGKVGFELRFIGNHGGSSLYGKLKASSERIIALAELVKNWLPDCALSFSSPECARVSFGLGLRHVCVNDSPHAQSVARLTVPLSNVLLTPWIIPKSAWTKYGIKKQRIIRYKALDPAVWLKRRVIDMETSRMELDPSKKTILIRLEESHASYLQSYTGSWTTRLLNEMSASFSQCNIVVLCRYEDQLTITKEKYGSRFIIPTDVVDGTSLISVSDVFVGMGGTMTAEAALLGVPTISAYPGETIFTEKYLMNKGLLVKPHSIQGIIRIAKRFLNDLERRERLEGKAQRILSRMEDPVQKIISAVEC